MKALVTGGGGFLGKAIVRLLIERGAATRSFQRGDYPELANLGVDVHRGDLADGEAVDRAVDGCDVVFHVAAKAGVWGPYDAYYQANVVGTENVLAACRRHGVAKLVYTSTPSVVHAGADVEGVDETAPYAEHFETCYPATKAAAEKLVLAANEASPDDPASNDPASNDHSLATVALRPHLIWGPEDNHLVPRIVERAKAGRLRLVGGGTKRVDSIYVTNAAEAHLLAADRLAPGAPCAGKAYFLSQGEPWPMADLVNGILAAAGLPPCTKSVSPGVAYAAGAVLETAYRLLGNREEPPMTRFVARQLATAHWYDLSAARRDLGYEPRLSIDDGLVELRRWFESRANDDDSG